MKSDLLLSNSTKTVMITGGSGGLGFELARQFAKDKYRIVLIARNEGNLKKAASSLEEEFDADVKVFSCDLSDIAAVDGLYYLLENQAVHIDVLVNNAGTGTYGLFQDTDMDAEQIMMQLNMITLVKLTKLFLKPMIKKGEGRILNIGSICSFQPVPRLNIYAASKAFVLSFSESLRNEVKNTGVIVSTLCPGTFRSQFQETANMKNSANLNAKLMTSAVIAEKGYKGFMKNQPVIVPGFMDRVNAVFAKILPRNLIVKLSGHSIREVA